MLPPAALHNTRIEIRVMNDHTQSAPFGMRGFSILPRRVFLAAVICLFTSLTVADPLNAQVVYRGFRPRGAVIVAPPIVPAPVYGPRWAPPPIVAGPPSSVRVQTPFFSLNIGPGGIAPPSYPYYGYRYQTYRPSDSYGYRYESRPGYRHPSDLYRPGPAVVSPVAPSADPGSYGRYQAGPGGGLPQVTARPNFSLQELRQAAEALRASLSRRPDDADVWLDYLQPDTIIADVVEGEPSPAMAALLRRYDGVTMNPDLVAITRLRGFHETRQLLATWLQASAPSEPTPAPVERPTEPQLAPQVEPAQPRPGEIEPSPFHSERETPLDLDEPTESEEILPGPREPLN